MPIPDWAVTPALIAEIQQQQTQGFIAPRPSEHVIERISYFKSADRPGEVYKARPGTWLPDTDPDYISWSQQDWAKNLSFATMDDLVDHLEKSFVKHKIKTVARLKAKITKAIAKKLDAVTDGGVTVGGKQYKTAPDDRENISGVVPQASLARQSGVPDGELRWHGGAEDFTFTAADDTETPMDIAAVIGLGMAALNHKQLAIRNAKSLKQAVQTATTLAQLQAIDINAGWPAN
jgi:hypothetical protein